MSGTTNFIIVGHPQIKRLRINSNLFYNDYKDMQLPFTLGPNSIVIRNADKVVTYGAEINTEWQATEKLALNAASGC